MRPDRALIAAQGVAALGVLSLVTWVAAGGVHPLGAVSAEAPVAAALAVALLILGFFNVFLPRGDAVDTTAAVAFAAGCLLHPLLAALVVVLARCAIIIAKPRGQTGWAFVEYAGRRVVLMSLTFAVFGSGLLGRLGSTGIGPLSVEVALVAIAFVLSDALLDQMHVSLRYHAPFWSILVGTVRLQGLMIAAEASVAVLTILLFRTIQYWGLLVTVGLLLVMRQSFALLLAVRASYTSTVEALARSIEAYDQDRRGHAERVARMAAGAGRMLGLQGKRLEDLSYAALFHDVGLLATDDSDHESALRSSEVLSNVGFLAGAVPILAILDSAADEESSLDEEDLIAAYMIAHFSAVDMELHVGGRETNELADSIGARLYSRTRSTVDRAIRRVERGVRDGTFALTNPVEVVA